MSQCRRGHIFIDREVQGGLMLRVVSYWLFCLLTITLMLLCWSVTKGPPRTFATLMVDLYARYAPALAASLLLLPLVMVDVLRFSNRFVGPVLRVRGAMQRLAAGQAIETVAFRDGDMWNGLAVDFNRVVQRTNDLAGEDDELQVVPLPGVKG